MRGSWWWLLPLNTFLFAPVLLYELYLRDGGLNASALFVLCASLLWLAAVQLLQRRLWLTHLLLFPFYLLAAVDLFVVVHYDTRLGSSTLLTMFGNTEDALGYLREHWEPILAVLVPVLTGYACCVWGLRNLAPLSDGTPRVGPCGVLSG